MSKFAELRRERKEFKRYIEKPMVLQEQEAFEPEERIASIRKRWAGFVSGLPMVMSQPEQRLATSDGADYANSNVFTRDK